MESSAGILLVHPIFIGVHDEDVLVVSMGISSSVATSIGVGVAAELVVEWSVRSQLAGRGSRLGREDCWHLFL